MEAEFSQLKQSITIDIQNRNLKNTSIRLNALESVEKLLKLEISEMINDPCKLIRLLEKDQLKKSLSARKSNGNLNGAEESIINEIYCRI